MNASARYTERIDGIGGRTTRCKYQLVRLQQGRGTQEAHLVHPRRADRLSARHLRSSARHRPGGVRGLVPRPQAGRARHVQHVLGRRGAAHGGVRAQHHALHFGLDHHPAVELGDSGAGEDQEGRRAGAQSPQPIYALPDRGPRGLPGLRHIDRPRGQGGDRRRSRPVVPRLDGADADRRHHVPGVARRADNPARRRQRIVAHHLRRHCREAAAGGGRTLRTRA